VSNALALRLRHTHISVRPTAATLRMRNLLGAYRVANMEKYVKARRAVT